MYTGEGSSGSRPGGVYPGEGPGSQLSAEQEIFNQLTGQIGLFIQIYSELKPCSSVEPRKLGNQAGEQQITDYQQQSDNLEYDNVDDQFNHLLQTFGDFNPFTANRAEQKPRNCAAI
uniref:Uncharacterized protein n=1 Tax=Meloidogyne incognita TaxID=6306 RepID=A0A914LKZ8_MELIC